MIKHLFAKCLFVLELVLMFEPVLFLSVALAFSFTFASFIVFYVPLQDSLDLATEFMEVNFLSHHFLFTLEFTVTAVFKREI